MTRRRWICLWLASVLALGMAAWFFWPDSLAVRVYERLRLGMTRDDAEAAIGKAPFIGDALTEPAAAGYLFLSADDFGGSVARQVGIPVSGLRAAWAGDETAGSEKHPFSVWLFEDYGIIVAYGPTGQVVGYYLVEIPSIKLAPLLDRIRDRLGL